MSIFYFKKWQCVTLFHSQGWEISKTKNSRWYAVLHFLWVQHWLKLSTMTFNNNEIKRENLVKFLQPWTKYIGTFEYFLNFALSPNFNVAPGWRSVPIETTLHSTTLENGERGLLLKKSRIDYKITKIFKSCKRYHWWKNLP